jgi:hypothetical protein
VPGGEPDKNAGARPAFQCDNVMLSCCITPHCDSAMSVLLEAMKVNRHNANRNREIDGSDSVAIAPNPSGDGSITDSSDISRGDQQERERLRKLNRERVRRYRLRHRKGANDSGRTREAANSRKRIAGKAKPRTSTSSQQPGQQTFFLLILLSIIFLFVLGVSSITVHE